MDRMRRKILKTGAAATVMAAAPRVMAQQAAAGTAASFYEKGPVRIRYEDTGGSGVPLLLISGGGLNGSTIAGLHRGDPFNPIAEFRNEFRCIGSLRAWDITDRLSEIDVPTLVVSGAHDEATPLIVGTIHERIPGALWELFADSSHMPHVEEPDRFL